MNYYSAITKESNRVICRDMDRPRVCHKREISQKNKYHILMHIYAILKNGPAEPICRAGIETQT